MSTLLARGTKWKAGLRHRTSGLTSCFQTEVLINAGAFLLPLLLSLAFIHEPLGRDQGYFAYGGWRICHGELPYSHFWANTFPLVFWWYAILECIAGHGHGLHAAANGIIVGATSLITIRLRKDVSGVFAAYLYGCTAVLLHRFWDTGQAEQIINLSMVVSLFFLLHGRTFLSGTFFGLTLLSKPTGLLFLPILYRRHSYKMLLLGIATIVAVAIIPYVVTGSLSQMIRDLFEFNRAYGSTRWDGSLPGRFINNALFRAAGLYPLLLLAGLTIWKCWSEQRVYMAWLFLALGSVLLQGKLFSYHWIPTLLPLCILGGTGLKSTLGGSHRMKVALLLIVILLLPLSWSSVRDTWVPAAVEFRLGVSRAAGKMTHDEYLAFFGDKRSGSDFSALEQYRASKLLRESPERTMLVWGFEPGLNYLSNKPCPSRYVVDFPLTFPSDDLRMSRLRKRYMHEFMQDLQDHPAELFVIVTGDSNPVEYDDSYTQLIKIDSLLQFVEAKYRLRGISDSYKILEIRP